MHSTNGSVHAVLDRARTMPDDRGFVESLRGACDRLQGRCPRSLRLWPASRTGPGTRHSPSRPLGSSRRRMGRILRDGVAVPRHQGSNGSRRPFVVAPSRERFATVERLRNARRRVRRRGRRPGLRGLSPRGGLRHRSDCHPTGPPFAGAGGHPSYARGGPDRRRGPAPSSATPAGPGSIAVASSTCAPRVRFDLAVPSAERATASTAGPAIPGDPASPWRTG